MPGSDSLKASSDFEEFGSYAAAVSGFSGISRRVVCLADGTLIVKQADGGTQRTLTVKAGQPLEISITAIVTGGSGCAPIQVFR